MLHLAQSAWRKPTRILLAALPALALTACGADREAELELQLAEAQTAAETAESDKLSAERKIKQEQAEKKQESLATFYGDDEDLEDDAAADDEMDDSDSNSGGGSFDDPTSDYFDNTIAAPAASGPADSGAEDTTDA